MSAGLPRAHSAQLLCGVLAGPLFVTAFTVIGAARRGYDWRRYPVSSLAVGRQGWYQRINFILAGVLYSCAAAGLAHCDRRRIGPRPVPALVAGAGIGLIGSGVFVTDYVGDLLGERPDVKNRGAAPARPTRAGQIHDLCGIPVFAGIPVAGLASAATAVRSGDYRWACYSAGSSTVMAGSLLLLGAAIRGRSRLDGKSGLFQRISIATGLGWLSSLSLRGLCQ
ncbi:DUF998 domain-containing protein [Mycobacterium sp. 852014-50255_SCH5639931]|uniref:DUF998 domain-containing protein n=1 Tax=Mycobacterium sp. 852014-50255_SCH5639931 TaxID=1834112 RepID=UPI0009ED644B|nr:DUF998 domain-containing protein [Mycobacterium sp. 852014-50255_SCH5639931]